MPHLPDDLPQVGVKNSIDQTPSRGCCTRLCVVEVAECTFPFADQTCEYPRFVSGQQPVMLEAFEERRGCVSQVVEQQQPKCLLRPSRRPETILLDRIDSPEVGKVAESMLPGPHLQREGRPVIPC